LTNIQDCIKRKLVEEGENPLEKAAKQLKKHGVSILHTCGGDDTNLQAAMLSSYLHLHLHEIEEGESIEKEEKDEKDEKDEKEERDDYSLCVVGLPKTVDNDVFPIIQVGIFRDRTYGVMEL